MKPSKIILTLEDNLIGCELNDSQGRILDIHNMSKEECSHVINALNVALHDLFLKYLKTK